MEDTEKSRVETEDTEDTSVSCLRAKKTTANESLDAAKNHDKLCCLETTHMSDTDDELEFDEETLNHFAMSPPIKEGHPKKTIL